MVIEFQHRTSANVPIWIQYDEEGEVVTLNVGDDGALFGLAEWEDVKKMFTRFDRAVSASVSSSKDERIGW